MYAVVMHNSVYIFSLMYLCNINMYCTYIYIYIYTSTINPLINDYVSGRVDEVKKKKSVQVQTYVVRRI